MDLKTLKRIKFSFDICSDGSTFTMGYRHLCELVKHHPENKIPADHENFYHGVDLSKRERDSSILGTTNKKIKNS